MEYFASWFVVLAAGAAAFWYNNRRQYRRAHLARSVVEREELSNQILGPRRRIRRVVWALTIFALLAGAWAVRSML